MHPNSGVNVSRGALLGLDCSEKWNLVEMDAFVATVCDCSKCIVYVGSIGYILYNLCIMFMTVGSVSF